MKTLLPIILLLISFNLTAQHKNREQIKSLKVSFLTEKLDLTAKEAQEFWPVYNAYEKAYYSIRHNEIKNIRKEIKSNLDNLNNEKAKELLQKLNNAETNMHELRIRFSKNLLKILSPKKIILFKVAEEDFKRKMFDEYKKRKKEKN
ncbi:sensor of ECF-type sigma factor [Algibacter sp. PT7-4]|uniref:sensor of ECF-type sigma factor n=1 Tax=Algibacter ulvanivorans TaxID=3400999 RepID=UPI003AAD4363